MANSDRRDLLKKAAALGIGAMISAREASPVTAGARGQAQPSPTTTTFFPGFKQLTAKTSGATINYVTAGSGPPLLLLHGYPETHIM